MYATRVQIFLGVFAFKKRWMCVVTVTDGSTGYVVGFITRSIGKDIKIQENAATTKVPYIYRRRIQNMKLLETLLEVLVLRVQKRIHRFL